MLRSRLFFGTGNSEFSCKLFLEVKVEDEFQECRQIISEIFEEYILSTKRFKTQYIYAPAMTMAGALSVTPVRPYVPTYVCPNF